MIRNSVTITINGKLIPTIKSVSWFCGNARSYICSVTFIYLITAETIDPTATGKVTVINFWGTWCGPCVAELPYFNEVASRFGDALTVIAVHSNQGIDTAPAYIADNYASSNIIFAKDNAGADPLNGALYTALGFRMTYPATVVLDENGVIIYTGITPFHSVDDLLAVLPESVTG